MSVPGCHTDDEFNQACCLIDNAERVFGACTVFLISTQGEIQTGDDSHNNALQEDVRQALSELESDATQQQTIPWIKSFSTHNKALCFLPLNSASEEYQFLIVLADECQLDEQDIHAKYYQLLYLFKQSQYQALQDRLAVAETWIQDELDEIARVQQLMLPDKDLSLPGVELAFTYRAMKGAGGDYLDIADLTRLTPNGEHDIAIIVADVSGHGPAAAVETAMIDAILRTFIPKDLNGPTAEVLSYINRHFFTRNVRGNFLTATTFRYSAEQQTLSYANAGHPHAYLKKRDELIALDQGGIPIGVLKEQEWLTYKVNVDKGDTLFIYTDVVVETKNSQGVQFGFERLAQVLAASSSAPKQLLAELETAMNDFCGCTKYQDDLTMCAIQFL